MSSARGACYCEFVESLFSIKLVVVVVVLFSLQRSLTLSSVWRIKSLCEDCGPADAC